MSSLLRSDQAKQAYEHIAQIRSEKFDLDGHSDTLLRVNRLATDLHNSITALSRDLYAKETHFIFELIQNAEDNAYRHGDRPYLSFRLLRDDPTDTPNARGALVIENNERGFAREHVEALCAVGQSTKIKAQGYIGEKGIGFKSVFRITSNPHVFSNGYAFRLPKEHKPTALGYIVPCWVDHTPKVVTVEHTTIILPLDQPATSFDDIAVRLREIRPETILFLRKLQHLRLQVDGELDAVLRKQRLKGMKVRLSYSNSHSSETQPKSLAADYWVVTKRFDKPPDVHAEKRNDVMQTDVTVALPLGADNAKGGQVFAYLPVYEDEKLPFIINADFLLTSAREAVQEREPWNEWLRGCVADTFVAAFEAMVAHQHYRAGIQISASFRLQVVPLARL